VASWLVESENTEPDLGPARLFDWALDCHHRGAANPEATPLVHDLKVVEQCDSGTLRMRADPHSPHLDARLIDDQQDPRSVGAHTCRKKLGELLSRPVLLYLAWPSGCLRKYRLHTNGWSEPATLGTLWLTSEAASHSSELGVRPSLS
jgi:hypothetical protein